MLLVHRPKYDDWTFPKGKARDGESDEDCALREVEEETGLRCSLEDELPASEYTDSRGRPKVVRYWLMRPEGGSFTPTDEVDEVEWLPVHEAERRLSYDRDRAVLRALRTAVIVLLVRHGRAGKRSEWDGEDRLRPLDEKGRRQADGLVDLLRDYAIDRVLSSPYLRCTQTVVPLAKVRGLEVEEAAELAEGSTEGDVVRLLRELESRCVVLCTHGDVVEKLVGDELPKGSVQVLEPAGGELSRVEYLGRPPVASSR